jgi:hypothetical protein
MDFRAVTLFRVELTGDEFRLVSRALRGALRGADEEAAALALQEKMLRARHVALAQQLTESQKAMENIDAAHEAAEEGR